jgi:hypothetical protein
LSPSSVEMVLFHHRQKISVDKKFNRVGFFWRVCRPTHCGDNQWVGHFSLWLQQWQAMAISVTSGFTVSQTVGRPK